MSCPTCDHTMVSVGLSRNGYDTVYWCPRCGTVKDAGVACEPVLVTRCIKYAGTLKDEKKIEDFERCGILESILPPGERGMA